MEVNTNVETCLLLCLLKFWFTDFTRLQHDVHTNKRRVIFFRATTCIAWFEHKITLYQHSADAVIGNKTDKQVIFYDETTKCEIEKRQK